MNSGSCCLCGAPAEIGFPVGDEVRWLCPVHASWQCIGCGPEGGEEDHYPAPDRITAEEES